MSPEDNKDHYKADVKPKAAVDIMTLRKSYNFMHDGISHLIRFNVSKMDVTKDESDRRYLGGKAKAYEEVLKVVNRMLERLDTGG